MPAGLARCRAAACLALAGLACLVLAACSPGADYPSLFPSVHDIPPPRSDIRLDQNQVQQATEDLITARDRLTAEAQSAQAKSATGSTVKPATKSLSQSPAKSAASSAAKPSASKSSTGKSSTGKSSAGESSGNLAAGAAQASSRQMLGTDAGQAAAGAETK
jgi:hypothetical protein